MLVGMIALLLAAPAFAHTLPISFLTLVPDADYLHAELVLNPFELSFFAELDANHNRQLEPSELQANADALTRRLLDALKVSVGGKTLVAETAGFAPDAETHHIAFRAHYRVDARQAPVSIKSGLGVMTSGSHVTHVTFGKQPVQQARLDMQTHLAVFNAPVEIPRAPAQQPQTKAGTPVVIVLLLVSLPAMAVFVLFPLLLSTRRKHLSHAP